MLHIINPSSREPQLVIFKKSGKVGELALVVEHEIRQDGGGSALALDRVVLAIGQHSRFEVVPHLSGRACLLVIRNPLFIDFLELLIHLGPLSGKIVSNHHLRKQLLDPLLQPVHFGTFQRKLALQVQSMIGFIVHQGYYSRSHLWRREGEVVSQ
ncbi:hypothetical protein LIER_29749 [Lithospermum erythrorhizon]|uniref:Uncharacterized protein n=1 Tax=Lithospermum erythrorhizon TaxID=34254 RepID=A0AAV3RQF2_LITER